MKYDIILEESESFKSYYNEENRTLKLLNNASSINLFVGANNSGKSRFIRNLTTSQSKKIFIEEIRNLINFWNLSINDENVIFNNYKRHQNLGGFLVKDLESDYGEVKLVKFEKNDLYFENENKKLLDKNKDILAFNNVGIIQNSNIRLNGDFYGINDSDLKRINKLIDNLTNSISKKLIKSGMKTIFIPTLRTAHSIFQRKDDNSFSKISTDILKDTIIKSYHLDNEMVEVFTGMDLYYQIVNVRNDIKDKRVGFEKFEEFLSQNFFHGKRVEIVAKFNIYDKHNGKDDSEIINVFIDEESKDLHELGDGIQALFILMYKIYTCENDSIIFIDEPEINLHPGMQRLFLEQITSNKFLKEKKITYFISTHSNHFLDLTIEKEDISIFLFNKINKDKFIVKNVNHGDNSALQYLGVTNSSVFLANCSIWVEGISDRNYLKAFLKAYCKDTLKVYPKEDIEFAFIEYAGSNIDHYNFDEDELKEKINAFSINNKIFLISDYDGPYKDEKHFFYEEIEKENNNFKYHTTKDYKEIENLLPFNIWDKILINFCDKRTVKTEEDFKKVQDKISNSLKRKNEETYKGDYIGKLLKNIKANVPELNKIWDKSEGTLMNKSEVSYKVLELTEKEQITWNDFKSNPKICSIVENLYDFIQKSNYK
ncbi:hypothetical protein C1631_004410 [Chryseobacterium phosphatilyticum]|uniref:Endonuclease GajA/Old nuclease/RecF-like AAA domain-containing protein n=1 Tax=Chryseobacterium phosphatilyticum TaxID=475075 RepID=A0A316XDD3_9FLAO|nr:AAA family ATPase [Chryseobacterium phosphatilyticum]PWN71865.1 hypothetical protein C1631_004410 [Chryseobacterium phosphatilyticum]